MRQTRIKLRERRNSRREEERRLKTKTESLRKSRRSKTYYRRGKGITTTTGNLDIGPENTDL